MVGVDEVIQSMNNYNPKQLNQLWFGRNFHRREKPIWPPPQGSFDKLYVLTTAYNSIKTIRNLNKFEFEFTSFALKFIQKKSL